MAIEIAYSYFCDMKKRRAYENMQLPALEIDLRAFTPSAFDVTQVKRVVLEDTACKYWLWPDRLEGTAMVEQLSTLPPAALAAQRQFLPEEIMTIRGRWISCRPGSLWAIPRDASQLGDSSLSGRGRSRTTAGNRLSHVATMQNLDERATKFQSALLLSG